MRGLRAAAAGERQKKEITVDEVASFLGILVTFLFFFYCQKPQNLECCQWQVKRLTLLVLGQTTKIGKLFLTLWKLGGGGMQDKTLLAEDVPRVIFHSESLHFPERTLCNSFKTIMTQTREDDALSTVFGLVTSYVDCF